MGQFIEWTGVIACTMAVVLIPDSTYSYLGFEPVALGPGCHAPARERDALSDLLGLDRDIQEQRLSAMDAAAWGELSSAIVGRYGALPAAHPKRADLLDLVAQAERPRARMLGARLWAMDAASFDSNLRLAFAEHGVLACQEALQEHVLGHQRSLCTKNLAPAIYLAQRGNAAGQPTLQRAWDWLDLDHDGAAKGLMIAYAIEQLESPGALDEMRSAVSARVRGASLEGNLKLARRMRTEAQWFEQLWDAEEAGFGLIELAWFGEKLGRHCQERGIQGSSSGAFFESNRACRTDAWAPSLPRGAWSI